MADAAVRVVLVLAVAGLAIGVGLVARRKVAYHPPLDIPAGTFDPGLIVFTSTTCRRCKEALAVAKATGAPMREVTYEIEAGLQEELGVTGVPLTVIIDRFGKIDRQFAGVVSERRLRNALRRSHL